MEIIYKPRQMGKTTELIKKSARDRSYIICMNQRECQRVFEHAKKMDLDISFPITFHEFIHRQYYGKGIGGFLIDNAELLLQQMSSVPIRAISITDSQSLTQQRTGRKRSEK